MKEFEVVGAKVTANKGGVWQVKKWVKGWHPAKGKLTVGLTGKETIITQNGVMPSGTFDVKGGKSGGAG